MRLGLLPLAPFLCWLLLGLVLLLLELAVPGVYLFWFGLAALATGFCTALAGALLAAWEAQIVLFIAFSIIALCAARSWFGKEKRSDAPFLNRKTEELLGQVFTLDAPLSGGSGEIVIHDTHWRIEGPDMPKGAKIRLTAYHDGTFTAHPAD